MHCSAQRPKEQIMAVRIVALLIPLAITLPQLQTSIDPAATLQEPAARALGAAAPPWSYDLRYASDGALTRVAFGSPMHDATPTIDSPAAPAAQTAPVPAVARKASAWHAVQRPARQAKPVKTATAKMPMRSTPHRSALAPQQDVCRPPAHCAPVVVAR
jgi:hypothetical protein